MKNLYLLTGLLLLSIITTSSTVKEKSPAAIAKELTFPVAGKSNIGSYWGAERDGGKRKHEGIDIFATKGTAVVALCDGIITSVGDDVLGGKTVWLQSDDYEWSAYYAHLDKQLVEEGQYVKKGELIGTVGNTGNAKTTPPHLHFGIYKEDGAVDPLPYVKTSPRISTPVTPDKKEVAKRAEKQRKEEVKETKKVAKRTKDQTINTAIKTAAVKVISDGLLRKVRGIKF